VNSIRVQLTAVVLSMMLLWISVDTVLNIRVLRGSFEVHRQEDITAIAQAVESGLRSVMNAGRKDMLHQTLEALGRGSETARVRVVDDTGRIIASSDPNDPKRLPVVPPEAAFGPNAVLVSGIFETVDGRRVTTSYTPVIFTRDCMRCHDTLRTIRAAIQLSMSFEATQTALSEVQNTLLVSSLTAFIVVGAMLWFATAFLIARPMRELEELMERVEAGDFTVRARPGNDEVGRLAERFNYMVSELSNTHEELKRTHADELERADRLATVGELAAGVAHEIKNPLAGISGAIEVIASELPPDDPDREIFAEVLVQINRVDKTLRDMLNFARPTQPAMVTSDINAVIRSFVPLLSRTPEHARIKRITELAENLPELNLDPDQIGQVLVNLSLNAFQSAAPDGTVAIRTRLNERDHTVELEVEDSGPGIKPDVAERIFKPFFTTKAKGTGLGLAICLRIARDHGGDLILADKGALGGARFILKIPLSAKS